MKKIFIFFMLITITIALFILPVNADTNLIVRNGGFEESETTGGRLSYWDFYDYQKDNKENPVTTFSVDNQIFAEGTQSAVINSTGTNDARYVQTVPVDPDSYYRLSCKIQTENVGADFKGANISVKEIFETSKDIKGTTTEFEEVVLYGKTGPDQEEMMITAGIGGFGSENSGKAWFDDLKLEKLDTSPEGVTIINFFRAPQAPVTAKDGGNKVFIIVLIILILLVGAFILATFLLGKKSKSNIKNNASTVPNKNFNSSKTLSELPEQKIQKLKLGKKDFIIMGVLTLVTAIIYFFNLGSFTAPQTFWQPARVGEYVTFDLGQEVDVSKLMIFGGVNERYPGDEGKYRIEYQKSDGTFALATTFEKVYTTTLTWTNVGISKRTSQIKISVDKSSGTLNEIAFYETGSKEAIKGVKIVDQTMNPSSKNKGIPEYLIDEQDLIPEKYSFLTGSYFDEIYHPRTAYEFIHSLSPYEITHPPLGKDIMSIGMLIFGAVPFGWRFMGVLFGVLNIPLMYMFGKKLFKKIFYATACGILMMFDFMNFTQSRIGLIDVYAVFFILLMYFFMYDYFVNKSYTLGFKKSLKPLLLSGIFLGIGAASKWIGLYAAAGLAFLFLIAKYNEYREYNYIGNSRKIKKPLWYKDFIPVYIWKTLGMCVLFFVVIPLIIYVLSYIPYALAEAQKGRSFFEVVWSNQDYMFGYHKGVTQTHPFSSTWYQWPVIYRPMWYFNSSNAAPGMASTIVAMGNPAIWWTGIVTLLLGAVIATYKKHKFMLVVYTAAACQYLVWALVPRTVYIYHFFSTVPFMIFTIVYLMKCLIDLYKNDDPLRAMKLRIFGLFISLSRKRIMVGLCILYLVVVVALFALFYPAISGYEVSKKWIEMLKWFPKWSF